MELFRSDYHVLIALAILLDILYIREKREGHPVWQGIDQRRFPRANFKCVVTIRQVGEPTAVSTNTENIGLGGICVMLDKGLDIFSPVDLELNLEDGKGPLKVQGTIVWVVRRRELRRGPSFDTGVEFAQLSAEDKARIEAILDKVKPNSKA